jgi:3-hydroxybutyryl-CoA dehydrogenase
MGSALPPSVTVAVIGAGTMGAGIAQIAALAGHRVQLHDMRFGAGDEAKRRIAEALAREVAKGRLAAEAADAAVARIGTVVTLPDTCVAGLVIEAIAEDLAVKRELFGGLEHVVAADCILASNTSSLSITSLGTGLKHPARVAGMHFFNPVPLMPLVEIVGGLATDRGVAETLFATAIAWGKTPVHAASTPGFIVNRCARPFYGEAWRLLAERAADTATIDAVVREAGGFRMGPFELMDLVGHDVNLAVTQSVWEAYYCDARYTPSPLQREMVAAGHLGRKTGRGFYSYAAGAARPEPRTEPAGPRPAAVTIHGEAPAVQALGSRIAASGAAVAKAPDDVRLGGPALRVTGTDGGAVWLAPADGRAATARAVAAGLRDLVAFDLALDYAKATRLAIAHADTCDAAAGALAAGALQAAGCAVSRVDDVPGMIVLRTVAMLANEAADAVVQGVAEPEAIDLAMEKGVSYPLGPLAWADRLGAATLATVLGHLAAAYPGERYRASPLIRRRALTGGAVDG